MSRAYAEQVMRDHCTITWDDQGGIRDTTDEERDQMRAAQAKKAHTLEPLAAVELTNVKFVAPKTTRYRAPREAYDSVDTLPLVGFLNKCRWPRKMAA